MEERVNCERTIHRTWDVLLIGGVSGAGKTTAAREIARRLAVPWIGVDDLRLALQWSRVMLPERTEALYFFEETPSVWDLPRERLRNGLIDVAELMTPAIEIVTLHHLHNGDPLIIEGDGIHPAIVERPELRWDIERDAVRTLFVHEPDAARLLESYALRQRQIVENYSRRQKPVQVRAEAELRNEARAKSLFSEWVAGEAGRRGLPVIASQPFETLADRILAAT